ncbi:MAG: glycosyltransferase family 1 protein [Chloroflexota bacterium]|nr:glycosyltransferase family 1 protein [Chloroflexota bacterium]
MSRAKGAAGMQAQDMVLNLFYQEPDPDRWLPWDRYPRRLVRRLLRGRPRPGGQERVFLNLCAGLREIGIAFRVNDFRHAREHPRELACIIGKPWLLDIMPWRNPILFGAAVFSHPSDDPDLFERRPVRRVLVPGPWMQRMCEPYWGSRVQAWPVGIDTARWTPLAAAPKDTDLLLYDKVRWERGQLEPDLLAPIKASMRAQGTSFIELRYGHYRERDFQQALARCRGMVFVCEHETQGIAYQQALSSGVPVLAWDRGGPWQDPTYYPHRVVYEPVTSVPYWDDRCGLRFRDIEAFPACLERFMGGLAAKRFDPRSYVLEELTLAARAREYASIAAAVQRESDLG